jgi:uncharacterized membrane-anchored protein
MKKKYWFFAVVALQVLSLLGMIGFKYSVIATGQTVVLQSVPIDPRDLLRGDFVRIRFAITQLDLSGITSDGAALQPGDAVYVTLRNNAPAWIPVKAGATLPALQDDEAVIKGKIINRNGNLLGVDYGIDSYYVGEGKGRPLEREKYWKLKLDRRGHAVIEGPASGP